MHCAEASPQAALANVRRFIAYRYLVRFQECYHIDSTGIRTHAPPSRERRWRQGFLASRERYLDLATSFVVVAKSRDACPHHTDENYPTKTEGTTRSSAREVRTIPSAPQSAHHW